MNKHLMNKHLFISLAIAITCAACAEDVETSSDELAVITPVSLSSANLTGAKAAASAIGGAALNSNSAQIVTLVGTAAGRATFTAIVACALPAGQSVVANGLTYNGVIGVAAGWRTAAPTAADKRWTTACVLGKTYATVPGNVSLRHDTNAALTSTLAERTAYPTVVGAYYGDMFQAVPTMYACGAIAWPAGSSPLVECARNLGAGTTGCGFTYTGLCPAAAGPCADKTAPYGTCTGGATAHAQVVTQYIP